MDEVETLNKQRDSLMTSLKEQPTDDIGKFRIVQNFWGQNFYG